MENRGRAYKRYKKYTFMKKRGLRIKGWYGSDGKSNAEFLKEIFKGETAIWVRSTGTPCSCFICSEKYKRPTKDKLNNIINNDMTL